MTNIYYIDRKTGRQEKETVFKEGGIHFLYGNTRISKTIGRTFLHLLAKWPFTSALYGWWQKQSFSKKSVEPFVKQFDVDASEFELPIDQFSSFNDFFIRTLKKGTRPIADTAAVIPADGRYLFYPTISRSDQFDVKMQPFCLKTVLQSEALADRYDQGSLVIARLCPTDCHRFYFPIDCTPSKTEYINGKLYSVNPFAIRKNPWIWGENRRTLTYLESADFGKVLFMEVGATAVGSIIQTFTPGKPYKKGDEKGYFSFGSALLLFFEKGKITFESDLINKNDLEIRCLIGESLGH